MAEQILYKKLSVKTRCWDEGDTRVGGGGDIALLDVFYLWTFLSLIFIFPNDMPVLAYTLRVTNASCAKIVSDNKWISSMMKCCDGYINTG